MKVEQEPRPYMNCAYCKIDIGNIPKWIGLEGRFYCSEKCLMLELNQSKSTVSPMTG